MEELELVEGEYYSYPYSSTCDFIFIYENRHGPNIGYTHFVDTDGGKYKIHGGVCDKKKNARKITKATPAQIAHLDACIKAGKYVDALKTDSYNIGDKVRIIGNNNSHNFNIGAIVTIARKIEDYDYQAKGSDGNYWFILPRDIELVKAKTKYELTYDKQVKNPTHVVKCILDYHCDVQKGNIFLALKDGDYGWYLYDGEGDYRVIRKEVFEVLEVLGDNSQPVVNESNTSKLSNNGSSKQVQSVSEQDSDRDRQGRAISQSRRRRIAATTRPVVYKEVSISSKKRTRVS